MNNRLDSLISDEVSPVGEYLDFLNENEAWLKRTREIVYLILNEMEIKGWNRTDLASQLGVTQQYVSKLLRGESNLSLKAIDKLEKTLGIQLIEVKSSNIPLNPKLKKVERFHFSH